MKIAGKAVYVDTAGKHHSIEGVCNVPNNVALQKLKVSGSFTFDEVSCDDVKISGECAGKAFNAKNISVEGTADIDSVKSESFNLSGSADINKLIAEDIIIESRKGTIGAIKCGKLKIFHEGTKEAETAILSRLLGVNLSHHSNSRVRIKNIDAETVELENCEVDIIKCRDAFIGANCAIKKLSVSGKCKVADDSTVGETIRT